MNLIFDFWTITLILARRGERTFSDERDKLQVQVVTKNFVRRMRLQAMSTSGRGPSDVSHSNWQTPIISYHAFAHNWGANGNFITLYCFFFICHKHFSRFCKYLKVQITFSAFDNFSSNDRSLQAISADSSPLPSSAAENM